MVRSVATRAFVPVSHVLEEFGDMMILTGRTIWSALRPPYPYGGELVSQFLFTLRLLAGIAAAGTLVSPWLLTFSMLFFLSLACIKRYTECRAVETASRRMHPRHVSRRR